MKWWHMSLSEVGKALRTSLNAGLSPEQAAKRLAEHGKNRLEQDGGKGGFLRRFLAQFNDFMVLLMLGAAAVSFAVSYWNGENDFVDSAIIIGIVVLNSLLGVIQESRAEKALEALKELSAPKARVLRGGQEKEIPAEDVVQGDVLLLHAGDYICADGRIFENHGMKTEESAITGESLAAEKEEKGLLPEETPLPMGAPLCLSQQQAWIRKSGGLPRFLRSRRTAKRLCRKSWAKRGKRWELARWRSAA